MKWADLLKGQAGRNRRGLGSQTQVLTLGLTGTTQGLFLWPLISWPSSPLGPSGSARNSPEFPDFLIYRMGTVLCTL
jgi:hypothetical protein